MDTFDIAFIGSGAASTIALMELLDGLAHHDKPQAKLQIAIVEKYNEFWKGIPYGSRSSVNSLTITAVTDFISSGKESPLFFTWLKKNLDRIIDLYTLNGGETALKWLADNDAAIGNETWHDIYIPRFFFGIYLEEKVQQLLETLSGQDKVELSLIQAQAIDVDNLHDGSYVVVLRPADGSERSIQTKKVLLAVGSPPVKQYLEVAPDAHFSYINDIYDRSLNDNLLTINKALTSTPEVANRNILLIGTNASCIELLYLLNNLPRTSEQINQIIMLSPTGSLPHHISETQMAAYPCDSLDALKNHGRYDIHDLVAAAKQDLERVVMNGAVNVPYTDHVIRYLIELMQPLDEESKRLFFGVYGMQLTRLIRRSGPAYKQAADNLIKNGKASFLKGHFKSVTDTGKGAALCYFPSGDDHQTLHDLSFKVIINCTGSNNLADCQLPLIQNLIAKHICKVNLSGKGFEVNENFEAAPQFYVFGPLLGGNLNKRIYFWHLENVARLLQLSPFLAQSLMS